MDSIGIALRNCFYHELMSGKFVIDTPKSFAEYADKEVKGITSLYLLAKDALIKPDSIEASPRIKYALQNHLIKWFFD